MRRFLTLLLVGLAIALPARADTTRDAAVAAWLNDDDATALPAFAALARTGDPLAAALLVVLEGRKPASPFRAGLTRDQAKEIFRAPGKKLGTPWLKALPSGIDPDLAVALQGVAAQDWPGALEAALAADDTAIAALALSELNRTDWQGVLRRDAVTPLPPPLRPILLYISASFENCCGPFPEAQAIRAEIAALPDGLLASVTRRALARVANPGTEDADRFLLYGLAASRSAPPYAAEVARIGPLLAAAPEASILTALCDRSCAEDADGCRLAGLVTLEGWLGLARIDTPLASAIPADRYRASPRARADLLRVAAGQAGRIGSELPSLPGAACYAALLPPG
ncbi:MAG: hypothetical protein ACT4OK_13435 [Gemmobacter sp.]